MSGRGGCGFRNGQGFTIRIKTNIYIYIYFEDAAWQSKHGHYWFKVWIPFLNHVLTCLFIEPCRKDKYENIYKYLVETEDTLEYNREHEEVVEHNLSFEVSGPSSAAFPTMGEGLLEETSGRPRRSKVPPDNASDEDMLDENTSESSDDDAGDGSKKNSRASSKKRHEQHVEEIPEDGMFYMV